MSSVPLPSHMMRLRGSQPGPRVVIFGGTHGDETMGVHVVRLILERLGLNAEKPEGEYMVTGVNGELVLGIGNPEAVAKAKRSVSDIRDLNRCFHESFFDDPEQMRLPDQQRASELKNLLAQADYFFDLHSVSTPHTIPFIGVTTYTPAHARVCPMFPVEHIVNVGSVLGHDIGIVQDAVMQTPTTCSWVNRNGGMGLCYEMGFQKDFSTVKLALEALMYVLESIGSVTQSFVDRIDIEVDRADKYHHDQKVYHLLYCERNRFNGFVYSEDRFERNWEPVTKGTLIGVYQDGNEVRTKCDGFIVFPAGKTTLERNNNLFYIATLDP